MKDKKETALDNFIDNKEIENDDEKNKEKIKSDFSIVERFDKIIIDESGRQLLREQY